MSRNSNLPRVIVIGVDGMDLGLTRSLMNEGRLPNFKRLADLGVFTAIQTTNPAQSPVAWSTISTGANPGEHGLFDFIWRHEESYLPDLSLAKLEPPKVLEIFGQKIPIGPPHYVSHRGGRAIWQLTSEEGIPTVVLRWPVTFPPEKVAGKMLSGMGVPDIRGGQGTFSFYTSKKMENERPQGGLVIPVEESEMIQTELVGPRGPQGSDITVPMKIAVDRAARSVRIQVGREAFELKEGSWSDWRRVKFSIDVFTKIPAMCRFYLKSLEHPFELYVSPMNFDPRNPIFPLSYEEDYAKRLQEAIGDFHTLGMPHDTWALNEGSMNEEMFLSQTDAIVAEERAMVLHELRTFRSGLFMMVFETIDRISHMFWRYRDKASPLYDAREAEKYGGVIERYYEGMDRILGEIMDFVDDRTTLIVNSDHGFSHFRRAVHLNAWLRENGFQTLKGDVAEGRALFRDVDWSKTQAYAVGLGSLYLNLRGRESKGIVDSGEEKKRVEEALISKLKALADPKTGEAVVHEVYRRADIFSGSRFEQMPDLVVAFKPGYRTSWQTALGATPKTVIEDNLKKWSGDHIIDPSFVPGVFFSNKKLSVDGDVSLYDLAPTVLNLFGIPALKEYSGRALFVAEKEVARAN